MMDSNPVAVTRLVVGPLSTNCYVLTVQGERAAIVIDPGGDAEKIIRCCQRKDVEASHLVLTHAHCDHIAACGDMKRAFPQAEICIGQGDAADLADEFRNLSGAFGARVDCPRPDRLLRDNDSIEIGSMSLKVLETPGHTCGGISLLLRGDAPTLFCGDLVFAGDVGRTDLPGGDMPTLQRSIREKLLTLPEESVIRPGHGPKTTVGKERQTNPYLSLADDVPQT